MKSYCEVPYVEFMANFAAVQGSDRDACDLSKEQLEAIGGLDCMLDGASETEETIRSNFCTKLNEVMEQAAAHQQHEEQRYVFKNVSNWSETTEDDLKLDIAMYPNTKPAQEAFEHDMTAAPSHAARNAWAWMVTGLKITQNPKCSAFRLNDSEPLLRETKKAVNSQTQLQNCATRLMVRQHRTFVFLVYIVADKARITRWDRAGCIVSSPISLATEPEKLLNFFYRLALMSEEDLGFDTTAVLASPDEVKELEGLTHKNPYAARRAKEILADQVLYPIYKISCPDIDGGRTSTYFVGKHLVASSSLTGCATRGFIAFRKGSPYLCFIKDYWRNISDDTPPELDVYRRLSQHDVKNVARALGGGKVFGQITITDQFLIYAGLRSKRMVHYRVVIEQLARPLEDYQCSADLIFIVYDALQGHKEAWEKAGILHCDISENNIMFVVNQDDDEDNDIEGILIDWDLCKYKSDLSQKATQYGRSGTWPFMSSASLRYPFKPNELADDLESFVHVITYYSLRFHHHNRTSKQLTEKVSPERLFTINMENSTLSDHVCLFYDMSISTCHQGVYTGGSGKCLSIREGQPPFSLDRNKTSSDLRTLISRLYQLLQKHYVVVDDAYLEEHYGLGERHNVPDSPTPMPKGDPEVLRIRRFSRRPLAAMKKTDNISSPSPSPVLQLPVTGGRALDTHEGILQIFGQICNDIIIRDREGQPQLPDKIQDQFYGLRRLITQSPEGPSGSKRKSTDSGRVTQAGEDAKRLRLTVPSSNSWSPSQNSRLQMTSRGIVHPK